MTYDVAHVKFADRDLVVLFVGDLSDWTPVQRETTRKRLQRCANHAGLAGVVALVWPGGWHAPPFAQPLVRDKSHDELYAYLSHTLEVA